MKNLWPIAVLLCAGCASSPLANRTPAFPLLPAARAQLIPTKFTATTQLIPTQPVVSTFALTSSQIVMVQSSSDLAHWSDFFVLGANPVTVTNLQPHQFFRGVQMVRLSWDASPDASVAGYKIYQGTASHDYVRVVDAGNVLTTVVTLLSGATNYFAATTYDSTGMESDFSNEASWITRPVTLTLK